MLKEYSRMIDDFAWFNKGNIFEIAKLAKKLGRDYMSDITQAKCQLLETFEYDVSFFDMR